MQREAWTIARAGSLDRLARRTETLEPPGPGEARIRVHAVGVNFADVFACLGLYSATPRGAFVPGLECAGVIEALGDVREDPRHGSANAPFSVGDRVVALTRFGAYATALNVGMAYLRRVPEGWDFPQAASWPVTALTAWYGLSHLARVKAGECVLVQSAAGGVGLSALGLLQAVGAQVVATVGSDSKREFLLREHPLAPGAVVVREPRRFGAQLDLALNSLGRTGFDVVFDAVAGPCFRPAYDRLRPEGRYVLYGAASFMPNRARPGYLRLAWKYLRRPRLDPLAMIAQNRSVMAFNLIWLWDDVERLPEAFAQASRVVPAPHVGRQFDFSEAPQALRHLQSGDSIGKVVLVVRAGAQAEVGLGLLVASHTTL
jgi:alcohol dehydrogenase